MNDSRFAMFDQLDIERVVEVVDLVWKDREKILNGAELVWENREKLLAVIKFVLEHQEMLLQVLDFVRDQRQRIMEMIDNLPDLLHTTGNLIEAAGASAIQASAFLTGDTSRKESFSALDLAESAASALERCQTELRDAAQVLDSLGRELDKVRIPQISPKFIEVMGLNVVSGIELGELTLIDNAADRLQSGAERLTTISNDFQMVARQMRKLGAALTDTGNDLNRVGAQLQQGGGTLRSLARSSATKPRIRATTTKKRQAPSTRSTRPTAKAPMRKPARKR